MKEKPGRNRGFSGYFAIIVMCLAVIVALEFSRERTTRTDMSYTIGQLTADVEKGNVTHAVITPNAEAPTGASRP